MYVFTVSGRHVYQSTHWRSEAIVDSVFSLHCVGYRAQVVRLGAKCLHLLGYLPAHCHDFCGNCRCYPSSNSSFLLAPAALSHSCLKGLVSAAQASRRCPEGHRNHSSPCIAPRETTSSVPEQGHHGDSLTRL